MSPKPFRVILLELKYSEAVRGVIVRSLFLNQNPTKYTATFRHLRDRRTSLVLWVDAICINQMDIAEKSHQVALMGQIYQQCSRVQIWLGCNVAECDLFSPIKRVDSMMDEPAKRQNPFDLIRHLAKDRHIHELPCFSTSGEDGRVVFEENKTFDGLWAGFLTVAESKWWSRMWTVQEVILPKQGVLTYDTWNAQLEDITKCGTNYYNHVWSCCQQATASLPRDIGIALDEFCTSFFTLDSDRNNLAEDEYFDILDQNLSYGRRECQDPRDKVYGLLSLIGDISDLDLWLTPNYSLSHNQVYYDATCAMLFRGLHDLKCLTGAEYGPGPGKWASWVRDFGAPLTQLDADIGSNRLIIYDLFNSCSGHKSAYKHYMTWPQLADEKPHQAGLGITGKCVGTVALVSEKISEGGSAEEVLQRRRIFRQWVQSSSTIDLDTLFSSQLGSDEIEKLWRTILSGVASTGSAENSDWRRYIREDIAWLEPFLIWTKSGEPDLEFAQNRTILIATHGKCYFQTHGKGQGLCYPKVRGGDEVWIINGSKVPLVLRQVEQDVDEGAELRPIDAYGLDAEGAYGVKADVEPTKPDAYYELIGDCYFDGFMDGEAVHDASLPWSSILLL